MENRVHVNRVVAASVAAVSVLAVLGTAADSSAVTVTAKPLPTRMKDTGGGDELITAVSSGKTNAARTGTLTWWRRKGKTWIKIGSAPARFGYNGLSDNRLEGDGTTPTGIYTLPLAFGLKPNPGTRLPWRHVDGGSWWDENSLKPRYNTWHENCPVTICWKASTRSAHSSEHLADYPVQYAYAAFIGFNAGTRQVRPPARPSGSGIFLHVNGTGYTAGCVSIPRSSLVALLKWLNPAAKPHIAIGNSASITRF
jgi:L,D-peptidoglycan transpeptidase YkuD (ErfK/YbiS/YcfS/YnhG family)